MGERPVREPIGYRVRAEPADRGGVHHASGRQGGRRRAIDQAAQLRRHGHRELRAEVLGRTRRRRRRRARAGSAPAAGGHGSGRGAPRRAGARAAQLTGRAVGPAVLQHAVRRKRGEPRRVRLGVQVHAERRRADGRRGLRARGRQPERRARRLHDRLAGARRGRRPADRRRRTAHAQRGMGRRVVAQAFRPA